MILIKFDQKRMRAGERVFKKQAVCDILIYNVWI